MRALTLGSMGVRIGRKRFITVVKPSNYKGSALLGVLNLLSGPASKRCCLGKARMSGCARTRHAGLHGKIVNFMFRDFGLVSRLGMCRGVRLPLLCVNVPTARHGHQIRATVRHVTVVRHDGRFPRRLSNKRRRHITVTHTIMSGPGLVLTSRPANGLSSGGKGRMVRLLGRLGGRNAAVIVIARSRRSTKFTKHVVGLFSKRMIARTGLWFALLPVCVRITVFFPLWSTYFFKGDFPFFYFYHPGYLVLLPVGFLLPRFGWRGVGACAPSPLGTRGVALPSGLARLARTVTHGIRRM